MKFVVPIPLSLVIIGLLIVSSLFTGVVMFVLGGVIAICFLCALFTAPKQTIVVVLLLVAIKYWQIALITGAVILVISFVIRLFKPKEQPAPSLEVAPSTGARPTTESAEAK